MVKVFEVWGFVIEVFVGFWRWVRKRKLFCWVFLFLWAYISCFVVSSDCRKWGRSVWRGFSDINSWFRVGNCVIWKSTSCFGRCGERTLVRRLEASRVVVVILVRWFSGI